MVFGGLRGVLGIFLVVSGALGGSWGYFFWDFQTPLFDTPLFREPEKPAPSPRRLGAGSSIDRQGLSQESEAPASKRAP